MEVIISEWALDSYLDLKHRNVFTRNDYKTVIRPDVERLKVYPNDPMFTDAKFWGPVTYGTNMVSGASKMKWHNLGPGKVQLRLLVAMVTPDEAVLCRSYVKSSPSVDRREMAKMKSYINKIVSNTYTIRGKLP